MYSLRNSVRASVDAEMFSLELRRMAIPLADSTKQLMFLFLDNRRAFQRFLAPHLNAGMDARIPTGVSR